MKIYNKSAITRQERFQNAVIAGVLSTLVCLIGYGFVSSILRIEFSIVYLGIGYFVGEMIRKYGRGVQPQFSILAAVLVSICFIFGDMITIFGFDILFNPLHWFTGIQVVFMQLLSTNISSLLSLLFRIGGVYFAYNNARI